MTTTLTHSSSDLDGLKNRYLDMTPGERLTELESLHQAAVQNAVHQAALVWSMKQRGDDMRPARKAVGCMMWILLGIAEGTFTVNALRVWGKEMRYLDVLKKLLPPDQELLCEQSVPVVERAADGTFTHRLMKFDEIVDSNLTAQVFDDGTIRSVPEQEAWLKINDRRKKRRTLPDAEVIGPARIDRVAKTVRVGNQILSFDEWRRIARLLGD